MSLPREHTSRGSGIVVLVLSALAACSKGCSSDVAQIVPSLHAPDAGRGSDATVPESPYSIDVSAADRTIAVRRGADVLVTLPADGIQIGTLPAVTDDLSFDPTPFVGNAAAEPPGLVWSAITELDVASDSGASMRVVFANGMTASLELAEPEWGRFDAKLVPTSSAEGGGGIAYFRLRVHVTDTERFYGLGEYLDSVNHRGKVRAMQLELDLGLESSYNEAHVPVPFLIGTRGWGLFVESRRPMAFDVAATDPSVVDVTTGTGTASSDGIAFHLFAAEHPLDVTKLYYDVTGYPRVPSRWALGPIVWRNEDTGQSEVENDVKTMRDLDLATTAIWVDRPYATAVNTFDFDPANYSDPAAMIGRAHDLGFRVALWHTPYLDETDPTAMVATQTLRDQATSGGFFPPATGLLFNGWGRPIDFTNVDAVAYWLTLLKRYTDLGVEGFKLDYGEDVVVGLGGARTNWKFSDGSDERTMHAGYQLGYHRTYDAALPKDGGFLLCRSGTWGDQAHATVIWPGDLDATFATHRENATDGTKTYASVGGLPASVIAGLSLGPSGFPLFGADTGGYRHSPPDQELFMRWFEQTALSTVMQIGTSTNTVAWELTQNGFDQSELDAYRKYTRLHLRLWPYEWTHLQRLRRDGRPITRALGLAYPELGEDPNDEYLFGDDILVAPIVTRGATNRDVSFPPGKWLDWWTGTEHVGPGHETIAAPLDVLPLFVRTGGIVPMLRPTIDAIAGTTLPDQVDSYATTPGVLYVRVAPGSDARFAVFDGTLVEQQNTKTGVTLVSESGAEFTYGTLFELIGWKAEPSTVRDAAGTALARAADLSALEAAPSGYTYDPAATGGTVYVKVPTDKGPVDVVR